jgi:uncharacterized protein (DUF2141 family)
MTQEDFMKNLRKMILTLLLVILLAVPVVAEELTVTLEITSVKINGGTVFAAIYNSAESVKKGAAYAKFRLEPNAGTLFTEVRLAEGFYRIAVFQDENGNGGLDTGLFGVPIEPFGISNYKGRGIPGGFEKLKVKVESGVSKIAVNLDYYR